MNDHSEKDYINDKVLKLITSLGYKHRTSNYYIIRENDGYININSYFDGNSNEIIKFHKNMYSTSTYAHDEIDLKFSTYNDFEKFIESYHKVKCRKLKLQKINFIFNI